MSQATRALVSVAFAAMLGMLAGCASPEAAADGDDAEASRAGSEAAPSDAQTDASSPSPERTEPAIELGPLSKILNQVGASDTDDDQDAMRAQQRRIEAAIQKCMQDQGFEYQLAPEGGGADLAPIDIGDVEYGTREYAEQYGYGVTTMDAARQAKEDQVAAYEASDPNAQYVAGMSDAEKDAYYMALWGETYAEFTTPRGPDVGPIEDETPNPAAKNACALTAYENATDEANAPFLDPAFSDLQAEINDFWAGEASDPAIALLDADWSACMADAGYDYAKRYDPQTALMEEYQAMGGAEASDEDKAALRTKEIETAVADFDCVASTDYDKKRDEASFARQQEFVDEHKDELDAWAEAYTTDGK